MKLCLFVFCILLSPSLLLATSTNKKPIRADVPLPSVLVHVNGTDITRAQLERYSDMMVAFLKNSKKNVSAELVAKFRKRNLKPFSDNLYRRRVISTCLAHSNIVELAEARAAVEKEYLQKFGKRKQTFAELQKVIEDAGFKKEFHDNFTYDVRFESFIRTVYSNDFYITQEKVDQVRTNLNAYNKRASATNEVNVALAKSLLERLKKGEDFAKLADVYSADEDKNAGGDLGECDESDFVEEPYIWRMLTKMKDGDVSEMIETEEGYAIYKVVQHKTAEQSLTGDPALVVSRIFLRRAYIFPEQTNEELWSDVEKETRTKLYSNIYKKFRAQSTVSYPNRPIRANRKEPTKK